MLIGASAASIRLYAIWALLPRMFDTENMRAGFALASRGVLADPFILPTGPTAHVAPLYPALIAGSVRLAGDAELGLLIARSALAILFGAFLALLPALAQFVGFERRAGRVAALVFLVPTPPIFMWIEATGQHETVLTAVLFATAVAATLGSMRLDQLQPRRAVALGCAWGVAAHASPVIAPPLAVLLATGLVLPRIDRRQLLGFSAILLATMIVVVTPWTLRNARVIGGFAFIRDNFGLELAVSNSDSASPDMRENMGGTMTRHPFFDRNEAIEMRRQGERRYYAERSAEAKEWIRSHPGRFAELTAQRIYLFFVPRMGVEHHALFYIPLLTLFAIGAATAVVRRSPVALLVGVLLAFAAPHFLVQSSPRYSYPVLWILVLFASSAFLELWDRFAPRVQRWRASRVRA